MIVNENQSGMANTGVIDEDKRRSGVDFIIPPTMNPAKNAFITPTLSLKSSFPVGLKELFKSDIVASMLE